ncbi:hypothetical protein ACIBCR_17340 [Micromonospora echinospora]|uniref:hypothetical protein n=1 Tax=Micromonospora echinospora TaxID=1877 RepID=UPI0037AD989D
MEISEARIARAIAFALRRDVDVDDETYHFTASGEELPLTLPAPLLSEVVANLKSASVSGAAITTATSYEVAARTGRAIYPRDSGVIAKDQQNGLTYSLGPPSIEFMAYCCLYMLDSVESGKRLRGLGLFTLRNIQEGGDAVHNMQRSIRLRALRIEASTPRSRTFWQPRVDAFLFHYSYNRDLAIMPDSTLDRLIEPSRLQGIRRSSMETLDAPQRVYVADLVHHYRLGVSSESPMLEYLSYYHIAEHWFENVYHDDLVRRVQDLLTDPGFSLRRKNDVRGLIRNVTRAVQIRDEELVMSSEQSALQLTLERYVNVVDLRSDIEKYDSSLIGYYSQNKVRFADADVVDFLQSDETRIFKSLTKRVYKTRNALVHSKEGGKEKFTPFVDDNDLGMEIPLIRFIAERIIIATSDLATS